MRRLLVVLCLVWMLDGGLAGPPIHAAGAPALLTFSSLAASVGQHDDARGSGLPAKTVVRLVWWRGSPHWRVKDGNFYGIAVGERPVVLATGRSDQKGNVRIPFVVPADFGYIHLMTLSAGSTVLAQQGFTVIPSLSISPTMGPLGTPITVRLTGVGYRLYEAVWHLVYDNAPTGWLSAISTQGTAVAVIPATGSLGMHTLQVLSGTHPVPYLNQQQAPIYQPLIPTVLGASFQLTAGAPIVPRDPALQGLVRQAGGAIATGSAPTVRLDRLSGPVGSPIILRGSNFPSATTVHLSWSTIVGNRISGSGYETQDRPLGTIRTDRRGQFVFTIGTPDDLGGPHTISAGAGSGLVAAQIQYTITPSVRSIDPAVARPGAPITIHLKGVGWTQTANIYTLVLDNSYLGYGCGFNSQGDVTIHVLAPGQLGWHYVDLYPAIYQGQIFGTASAQSALGGNVSYFQIPMLNAIDHPGERLPAFHLAFQVRA